MKQIEELSYVDTKPDTYGEIKRKFSDFKVDEDLSFDPTGCGDHLFIKIKKMGLTTVDVAKKISEVTGSKLSTIGYSGMKDKYGECTQWFSAPLSESVSRSLGSIENANLNVVKSLRNQRKLRIGSHRKNQFDITLRNCIGGRDKFETRLKLIQERGLPNYYGTQRFGKNMQNITAVSKLMAAETEAPSCANKRSFNKRSSIERGILISAARAYLFNQVLSARLKMKNWTTYLPGDVLNLNGTDSYFLPGKDDQEDIVQQRLNLFDIHISGPLAGASCSKDKYITSAKAADIETKSLRSYETLLDGLRKLNISASRRPLRTKPENLKWSWIDETTLNIHFSLRKGCYATSLLREICLFN